jgi:hypothetical protein
MFTVIFATLFPMLLIGRSQHFTPSFSIDRISSVLPISNQIAALRVPLPAGLSFPFRMGVLPRFHIRAIFLRIGSATRSLLSVDPVAMLRLVCSRTSVETITILRAP